MDLIDKLDKYLEEGKKFMGSYVTHNKKIEVKMYNKGGMNGPFVMDVVTVKSNKKEEKEFSSSREMKAYWQKIHKANLK
jgi:hypothetical protein